MWMLGFFCALSTLAAGAETAHALPQTPQSVHARRHHAPVEQTALGGVEDEAPSLLQRGSFRLHGHRLEKTDLADDTSLGKGEIFGMPRVVVAVVADFIAMAIVLICIGVVLDCTKVAKPASTSVVTQGY
mmetsp:Transcript_23663/g.52100  ORF Transcript_23663/g.52100 Transcript_23663/m.52100 type:complete len:130 (+) Transcript_23663:151-540(+)|eukprot:CAMPEP_0204271360 /NCGR_PEP_ID=MMETSP0468-20130131/19662_1 /ASSEMBLY_ACC=CAM_ASM_000383 /TAXON_ID=2969 /ORGANISM="Oxyrrhis marina" /LENGTH=129 /DNA_ID=CAMNT_0051247019 /DNA_START=130 /DNA_END=519 /DNA_ORIENTATION=-